MVSLDEHYPNPCAFCKIAAAYPPDSSPIPSNPDPEKVDPQCFLLLSTPHVLAFLDILPIAPGHILLATRKHYQKLSDLHNTVPNTTPHGNSSSDAAAAREAREEARETSRALGEYLPLLSRALCRVTGIEDWNVVQNNGERAAQVVPHIHFHLIPRYQEGRREVEGRNGKVDVGMLKSWRVFGRGAREDLDEEEAAGMAKELREVMRNVPAVMRWTLASPTKLLGVHADTSRTPRAGQDGSQDGSQPQRGSADASKTRAILEERDATFLEHG
ncbi:hypothetical protein LTR91_024964 [Friedmanniomyces endolithicus]|uniref:HIT domain-containing protein n=1 Tax=Friedmanniomyces endolithicus TaxID=329885 RepID=A0AAN6H610_9PEZI|nr:hypothetical protein LTR75_014107 [Friedmanniomyces endolithicus]KAK0850420.1 hypothetical protein LTR03_004650 [Friedmanniomyces endolithicus]KAK0868336.1 hypothetical protein LTS02_003650 [Friedmanniomyces endolithicus]KAK0880286.1 hypothetical protein LTR87_005887 [Friedmanniomyces endolithicus]KAK0905615.1 hypothetical protein LTR02_006356 [Friedmanniomyces endolithicus]